MTKKAKIAVIFMSILFVISACQSPEADNTENIANDGISGIQTPKGVDIVDDIEEFEKVTGDQSYNRETDASTSFELLMGGTDTGEILYVNIGRNWFIYCDKNTGSSGLLCGKPDCEHIDESCNAYMSNSCWGVQYYNGYLYTVQSADGFVLTKLSVDGSERENLGKLTGVETISSGTQGYHTIGWIIHRGYIYYCYNWNAGTTKDTYYLNNSNCIYRKSLEKDSKPECIMALPMLSLSSECQLVGEGSYVYFIVPTAEETAGCLYRYNTESGKLEWFKEWGNEISNVAVHDNKIYFSENNRSEQKTKMYCYDTETKEKSTFSEIDGLAGVMQYDDEYMYIAYEDADEMWKWGIWNWEGEYIADLPYNNTFEEARHRQFAGSDDENIYICCMIANSEENTYTSVMGAYTIIEYIEKEDILDGEYEIKEWSEIADK